MTDVIQVRREGGAFVITLNRPERRNAFTTDALTAFLAALEEAERDRDARIVVIRGEGTHFCTGLDLDEFYRSASLPEAEHRREAGLMARALGRIVRMEKPTVALVQGKALGVGATIAIACDLVIASAGSTFAFPEVTYGFVPAFGATMLRRLVGDKAAFELVATGRAIRGEEAKLLGLVSRVVPDEGFDAVTGSAIRTLCTCAVETLGAVKGVFLATEGKPLEEALAISADINARARASQAFREAANQFLAMA